MVCYTKSRLITDYTFQPLLGQLGTETVTIWLQICQSTKNTFNNTNQNQLQANDIGKSLIGSGAFIHFVI
jgi:hypothetical protein